MKCPRCRKIDLVTRKHKETGVALDLCPQCSGIWFDAAELERLLDVAVKDLKPPRQTTERGIVCARCHGMMTAFQYPQTMVIIDMCEKCKSIWLDGKELTEIKLVRENLRKRNQLQEYAPIGGVKGALLHFIDSAFNSLKFWS